MRPCLCAVRRAGKEGRQQRLPADRGVQPLARRGPQGVPLSGCARHNTAHQCTPLSKRFSRAEDALALAGLPHAPLPVAPGCTRPASRAAPCSMSTSCGGRRASWCTPAMCSCQRTSPPPPTTSLSSCWTGRYPRTSPWCSWPMVGRKSERRPRWSRAATKNELLTPVEG